MSRLGISKLARPPHKYCIQQALPKFETAAFSRREDRLRAKALNEYLTTKRTKGSKLFANSKVTRLANLLHRKSKPTKILRKTLKDFRKSQRKSLSSSVDMRRYRKRIVGWLWKLHNETIQWNPTTFTIAARKWEIPANELINLVATKLVAELHSDLNRAGAAKATGYFIGFIHSEFCEYSNIYRFHFHGMVAGGMTGVIDNLRKRKKYKSPKGQRTSIKIARQKLTDLPSPLSYLLKSYWPGIYLGEELEGKRPQKPRRIAEPFHSEALLWLDQWNLEDITLLKGVSIKAGGQGFQVRNPYSYPRNGKSPNGQNSTPNTIDGGI